MRVWSIFPGYRTGKVGGQLGTIQAERRGFSGPFLHGAGRQPRTGKRAKYRGGSGLSWSSGTLADYCQTLWHDLTPYDRGHLGASGYWLALEIQGETGEHVQSGHCVAMIYEDVGAKI